MSGPLAIGNVVKHGNNVPKLGFQDLDKLLFAVVAHLCDQPAFFALEFTTQLLAKDKDGGLDIVEQEGNDGLSVLKHHGTPHQQVGQVLDLVQEMPQAGKHLDNLMVNECLHIVVQIFGPI